MKNTVNVMYFHGRTVDNHRFTIAGLFENNTLFLGIAVCGNKEHFIKSRGRTIACGRLLNQRSDASGKIEKHYAQTNKMRKDFTFFTEDVAQYNYFTHKELLEEFKLRKASKKDA